MPLRKVHLRRALLFAGATAALAVGCAAADPVTIVLDARAGSTSGKWSSWETLWKQDIADFEKTHPNIHVEYRSDWDSQKITIEMAAGSAPDIFEMWGAFGYAWGQSGSLLDLNPFVKRDFTQAEIQNFYPPQWDAGIVRYGDHAGERYGVPKYSNASVLYYNKDLFDQAGLGYPSDEDAAGRWTYDEMLAFAKKLTVKGSDGRTQRYGINFCLDCDGRYASFIWAYGGKVFNLPDQPDQYVMNQGAALDGLDYLASLARSEVYGGSFSGGTTAMQLDGSQGIGTGYENVIKNSFAWDIGPYPKGPSGSRGTWVASDMWGVNAATKHPKEVWEFIKYLVSDPAVERQETLTGQGPMTHSGYRIYSQVFRNYDSRWHVDSAQNAHIQYVGFVPYADKVTPLVGAAVTQIFNLTKSPKVAADEAAQQIKGMYQLLKSGQDAAKAKPVPITWTNQDWSSAAINELPIGDAKIDGDKLTIDGAGADIWGAQDGLHYVHQSVTGDFTAVVKLYSTADVNGWAKAGIMVRQSDDPGSTHLTVMGTGTNGIHIQYRPKANDSSKDMAGDGWDQKSPIWLKLERKGKSLTGYSSTDGSNWKKIGTTDTVELQDAVEVGLAATSHTFGVLGPAVFSDWSLTKG